MRRNGIAGLIASVTLAACAHDASTVESPGELVATQVGEVGGGDGEGALTDVFGVAVGSDGHVFLSEPPLARVVEFDADGAFVRVVGGRGKGPGEFAVPGGLFWRGDSLVVTDFTSGLSVFAPEGAFQRRISFVVSVPGTPFGGRPMFLLADGSVAVDVPPMGSESDPGVDVWLKTSREGEILDTLASLPMLGRVFSFRAKGRNVSGSHPLAWGPVLAVPPSADYFVIVQREPAESADASSYRVLRLDLGGDTVASAEIAYVPRPVSDAVVDSLADRMAGGRSKQLGVTRAEAAGILEENLAWPAYEPPVSNVLVGHDGTVWIGREKLGGGPIRWDVLGEDLNRIGQVALPRDLDPKVVARDALWGIQKDSLDVPHLLRFEVRGAGGASGG